MTTAGIRIWTFLLLTLPAAASGAEWEVSLRMPCFQPIVEPESLRCLADSAATETGLDSLYVRGVRFGDRDTILLGVVPVGGRECSEVDFTISIVPGTMGELFFSLRDRAGNRSCGDLHRVFAFPAVDPIEMSRVEPYYRLVVTQAAAGP